MSAFDSTISVPTVSTGTSLIVGSQKLADNQQQATPMSPMDSLRAVFDDMRDTLESIKENTFQTVELLKTSVVGKSQQERDQDIIEGETDVEPPAKEQGPGLFAKIGETLSNLNPFKGGMGPLTTFLLAGAALTALNLFGEKLDKPLGELVKSIKEGTIVEDLKATVKDIKEKLEPKIAEIKLKFEEFFDKTGTLFTGVSGIVTVVSDIIANIENYVDSFDTDGIEGLSKEEQTALWEDVRDQIGKAIWGLTGKLVTALTATLTFVTIAGVFSRLAPAAAITATGAGVAGLGLFGAAAIAAIAAAGIYSLYNRIQFAMNDELDKTPVPDNIVDKSSDFISKFLGGKDPEGGVVNAMDNAVTMGLVGAVIGGIAGSFFFGIGAVPGAAIGFRIGTLMGAGFGFIGSNELKKDLPSMQNAYDNTDSIISYFKGVKTDKETNEKLLNEQLDIVQESLITAEKNLAENDNSFNRRIVKNLKESEADILDNLKNLDENIANRASGGQISDIKKLIKGEENRINEMKADLLSGNLQDFQIQDTNQAILDAQDNIDDYNDQIKEITNKYKIIPSDRQPGFELQFQKMSSNKFDGIDRPKPRTNGEGVTVVDASKKGTNDNFIKQDQTIVASGLSSGDNFMTAVVLANKKAKMVT